MKKKRIIVLVVLLCFAGLIGWGYVRLNYYHGWKKIDLRKTWPKGQWLQVRLVEMFNDKEQVYFDIPKDRIEEFERLLRAEVSASPASSYMILDEYQFRIVTTNGKYYTRAIDGGDHISAETWYSYQISKKIKEWGLKKSQSTSDPNSAS